MSVGPTVVARHTQAREGIVRTLQEHACSCIARISGSAVASAVRSEGLRHLHHHVPLEDIPRITEAFYTTRACEADMWRMMVDVARDQSDLNEPFYLLREVFLRIVPPFKTYRNHPGYHARRRDVDVLKYEFVSHAPHRDSWAGEAVNLLNVWMALDTSPAAAGVTVIDGFDNVELPHSSEPPFYLSRDVSIPVVPRTFDLEPGDCVLFGADELHGTRLNTTDTTRVAVSGRLTTGVPRYWPQFAAINRDQWLRSTDVMSGEPEFTKSHETVTGGDAPAGDVERHRRLPRQIRASSYDGWIDACAEGETCGDRGLSVQIGDREVALFRVDSGVVALDNVCPHLYYRLANGPQQDGAVTCPGHCLSFEFETGVCVDDPTFSVRRHQTKVDGGRVYLKLS